MKLKLRTRYFLWIAFLLLLFNLFHGIILLFEELESAFTDPNEELWEEVMEAVEVTGLGFLILPVLLLIGWWASRQMTKPITRIADTAERISSGQLKERIDTKEMPEDEILSLATTLNQAFNKYQDHVERSNAFSGNASHQLRTPLTAIRSIGEVALQKSRTNDEYQEAMAEILDETRDMTHMMEHLLLLSRLEKDAVKKSFTPVQLTDIIQTEAEQLSALTTEKAIQLTLRVREEIKLSGNALLLGHVIRNLLENSIRFTPEKGEIKISTTSDSLTTLQCIVEDSGPGIPGPYQQSIFDRFTQIPSHHQKGNGLGLAIVKDIVQLHGGNIEAGSSELGGAKFSITFPAQA